MRRNLTNFYLPSFLLSAGFNFFPVARADTNFAHCDLAEKALAQSEQQLDPTTRLAAMSDLLADLIALDSEFQNKNSRQLKSMLVTCFNKKREAFKGHTLTDKSGLQSHTEYWRLMGSFAEVVEKVPPKALEFYQHALKMDPDDYISFKKAYRAWFLTRFAVLFGKTSHPDPTALDKFYAESNQMIKPILDNERFSKSVRADLLNVRAALVESIMNSQSGAQFDYKRRLELDPNDKSALFQAGAYAFDRKNWEEAHTYFDRLAGLEPNNLVVQTRNLDLKMRFNEDTKVVTLANTLTKQFPKEAHFLAALAWGQLHMGQNEKAAISNARALKLNGKDELARLNQSALLEKEGDAFLEKKMIAAALSSYDGSFKFNEKNISVRKKMSQMIYDYHSASGFKPVEVSQKDMDRLLDLLDPIFNKENLDKKNVETYILASAKSNRPRRGLKACAYYQDAYVNFTAIDLVGICYRLFKSNDEPVQADLLMKRASANPLFRQQRSELNSQLAQ